MRTVVVWPGFYSPSLPYASALQNSTLAKAMAALAHAQF
jgi:hypothetical protein